jgi:hypothetical protein
MEEVLYNAITAEPDMLYTVRTELLKAEPIQRIKLIVWRRS